MVKTLYRKVGSKEYSAEKVEELLERLAIKGVIPESFRRNIEVRVEVYGMLEKQLRLSGAINYKNDIPLKERFLTMNEEEYFEYLFDEHRSLIMK